MQTSRARREHDGKRKGNHRRGPLLDTGDQS